MVHLCQFYGYTPGQVRSLSLADVHSLVAHMNAVRMAENEAHRV